MDNGEGRLCNLLHEHLWSLFNRQARKAFISMKLKLYQCVLLIKKKHKIVMDNKF